MFSACRMQRPRAGFHRILRCFFSCMAGWKNFRRWIQNAFRISHPRWHMVCRLVGMKSTKKPEPRPNEPKQSRQVNKPAQPHTEGAPDNQDPKAQYEDKDES